MNSQWHDFLAAQGAVFAQDTLVHFGQPEQELQAASQGTIMADLSHLGLLQAEGDDAVTFLQGQVTNDVRLLDGSISHYAGYCNPKGRMLALFLAFAHHGRLHLQLHGGLKEAVLKRLKMYVLRSKVVLTDVSDTVVRLGIAGPGATALLEKCFGTVPQASHALVTLPQASLLRLPGAVPRYEVLCVPEHAAIIWSQLQAAATPVGTDAWEWLEIQAGIPDVTPATVEAFVPQMLNLDLLGGINFKKGCYTGQEIVARTHYLGKVKRRTVLAHLTGERRPLPGEPVHAVDATDPVGEIVRAAPAPASGFDALVEVRGENLTAGQLRWGDNVTLQLLAMPYPLEGQ